MTTAWPRALLGERRLRSPTRCGGCRLWEPYEEMLASDVADLGKCADAPMAGAVTAALFLQKFVPDGTALGPSRHLRLARRRPSPGGPRAATPWACARPGQHAPTPAMAA